MALVDASRGLVSRSVFTDREIAKREAERLWCRTWLFVCPTSAVGPPGSVTFARMGTDPVIVAPDFHVGTQVRIVLPRERVIFPPTTAQIGLERSAA